MPSPMMSPIRPPLALSYCCRRTAGRSRVVGLGEAVPDVGGVGQDADLAFDE